MENKTLIVLMICIILFGVVFIYNSQTTNNGGKLMEDKPLYQGPVPEGYDEQYFRETGITKPLEK